MLLFWKKNGVDAQLDGMRNTKTGELRLHTPAELEKFKEDFKGKEFLEPPNTFFEVKP